MSGWFPAADVGSNHPIFNTNVRMTAAKSMEGLSTRMCGDEQSDQRFLYEQMGIARIC
jgi:hypothetical protein